MEPDTKEQPSPILNPSSFFPEYGKTKNLWKRDPVTHVVLPHQTENRVVAELASAKIWYGTEKLDGCNMRIGLVPDRPEFVFVGGRTDAAVLNPGLVSAVQRDVMTAHDAGRFREALAPFKTEGKAVTIYGEGVGGGVQKNGADYGDHRFILFDVLIAPLTGGPGTWLALDDVLQFAATAGFQAAPIIVGMSTLAAAEEIALCGFDSVVAKNSTGIQRRAEGLVVRTRFPIFDTFGNLLKVKMRTKEMAEACWRLAEPKA